MDIDGIKRPASRQLKQTRPKTKNTPHFSSRQISFTVRGVPDTVLKRHIAGEKYGDFRTAPMGRSASSVIVVSSRQPEQTVAEERYDFVLPEYQEPEHPPRIVRGRRKFRLRWSKKGI